jgi:hypothetical protein
MAITYVGGTTSTWAGAANGTNAVSLTSLTGGSNTSPSIGDLVIVTYATGSTADRALTLTTSGYTDAATEQYANGSSFDTNFHVWYKYLSAADTSVSVDATGNNADAGAVAVQIFRGVDSSNVLDVASTVATGTATGRPNPAAITPTTAGAWIVMCYGSSATTGAVYTAPSDATNFRTATSVDTNDAMVGMGYNTSWTSGSFDPVAISAGGTTGAGDSWAAVTIALRPLVVPVWSSSTTASVAENTTLSYTCVASGSPTFSIVSGTDQAKFELSGSTLRWASNGTKDFEAPDDSDTNNTYVVTVRATNGAGTTDRTITVTVTNDTTGPTWTSSTTASVAENATLSYTCAATGASSYSIVSGADQAKFEISGTTLRWASNGTKDFESPNDSDTNNTYVVTVRATGAEGTTDQTITVTVTDVAPASATVFGPYVTSWFTPTAASNAGLDTPDWGTPTVANIQTAGDSTFIQLSAQLTSANSPSDYLITTGYGFTSADVPDAGTLVSFDMGIVRGNVESVAGAGTMPWKLVKAGSIVGSVVGTGFSWNNNGTNEFADTGTVATSGVSVSPSDVRNTGFGLAISAAWAALNVTAKIDRLRMRARYTRTSITTVTTLNVGDFVAYTNKASTASLTVTGGTGTSNFELYVDSSTWAIRIASSIPAGGTYTLQFTDTTNGTGADAAVDTLTIVVPATTPTLTAASGSYSLTGTAATLRIIRTLTAAPGSYSLTGTAANLTKRVTTVAAPGSYSLTGTAMTPYRRLFLTASSGSYSLSGTAMNPFRRYTTVAAPGSYSLTGTDVAFHRIHKLTAAPGSYTLTGTSATLIRRVILSTAVGVYTVTGQAATLTVGGPYKPTLLLCI